MIVLNLPIPPSANQLYRNAVRGDNTRRRIKTERYRTWIAAAGNELLRARQKPMEGYLNLVIGVGAPLNKDGSFSRKRPDIRNLQKAIEDLLVVHGLIRDDVDIVDTRIYWTFSIKSKRVEIEITSAVAFEEVA